MNKLILLPYKEKSQGAILMAKALGVEQVLRDQNWKPSEPTTALNWGRGDFPIWRRSVSTWINHPNAVMNAIDKVTALQMMHKAKVPAVEFTSDLAQARAWSRDGHAVFCRQELQGYDGAGIIVARKESELVEAPIYTKYVKKVHEYRIHVMNGEVFYANIKSPKKEQPKDAEPLIRTGKQGWFFVHLDPHEWPSQAAQQAAIGAVTGLGLDFGGVDLGVSKNGEVRVYEVNSAPELGPNTTAAYLAAFKKHYGQYKNNENVALGAL